MTKQSSSIEKINMKGKSKKQVNTKEFKQLSEQQINKLQNYTRTRNNLKNKNK